MPRVTGQVGYGLARARVPVRVERVDTGEVVATTVTATDGSFAVDVPAGLTAVQVAARGVAPYRALVEPAPTPDTPVAAPVAADGAVEYPPGSPGASRRARAHREAG